MWHSLKITVSTIVAIVAAIFSPVKTIPIDQVHLQQLPSAEQAPVLGNATNPIAGTSYSLYGSGVSSGATSITLTSLTIPQTGYKVLDADLSDTFYVTLEPGNRTRQEIASCTTVTQNANLTATLSGCTRGLLPYSPFTASSTYQFAHGGGTSVVFSNPPQLYEQFAAKGNAASITGAWTFSSTTLPRVESSTTNSQVGASTSTLATVGYVNSVASSGAANASISVNGIVEIATPQELAASTATGGTGAIIVAAGGQHSATSTATTTIVVAQPVGNSIAKIDPGFINTSSSYIWTGSSTYTGISQGVLVASGTTPIYGLSPGVLNNTIVSNGSIWQVSSTLNIIPLYWGFTNVTVPYTTTQVYLAPWNANTLTGYATTTPASVGMVITQPGTVRNCYFISNGGDTNGTTHYFLVKNSVTSTLDVPVPATASAASNTTGTVAVVAGDVLAFSIHNGSSSSGSNTNPRIGCELRY